MRTPTADCDSRVEMGIHYRFSKIVRQNDSIMVIVDRLIKVSHFIPMKSTFSARDVAQVLIQNIFRL